MKKIIVLVLVFLIACDVVSTRDPEEPDTGRDDYNPAGTPEILFENLINAFQDGSVDNYMNCFIDTLYTNAEFSFNPTSGALVKYPSLTEWSLTQERNYFTDLINRTEDGVVLLTLFDAEINQVADSAVYQYSYTITVPGTVNPERSVYSGISEFNIKLDSRNIWVISGWTDFERESDVSWSDLKGQFN